MSYSPHLSHYCSLLRTIALCSAIWLSMLISCNSPTTKPIPFFIPFAFDKQKWQEDSLACNGYRKSIIDSILLHKPHFLYKVNVDTFLFYLGGYHKTQEYNDEKHYYYWFESGFHCNTDLKNPTYYRLAFENEPFFVVIARRKDNIITTIALGVP